jgi:hypothetical protein
MPTKTWNGSNADWFTPGDWSPVGNPGPTDNVVFNSGEATLISTDAAIKVASITFTGGFLAIQDPGKIQSVSGNVSLSGNSAIALDGQDIGGGGGSSLTIGGKLTNTSTNGDSIDIGNSGITSADTLTVKGTGGLFNTGRINITGSAAAQATLNVANAAAGFGSGKGVESGTVILTNDALLEFKTGQITRLTACWSSMARKRVSPTPA